MSAPTAPPSLEFGDIAPRFRLDPAGGGAAFDSQADTVSGRPLALAFVASADNPAAAALKPRMAEIAQAGGMAYLVARRASADSDDSVLIDRDGRLTAHFAGGEGLVLIGRNGHVVAKLPGVTAKGVDRVVAIVRAQAADGAPKAAERQAPVLMVPDVFSPADCKRLIAVYNMDGNVFVEPGHGVQNRKTDYKMRIPEYGRKGARLGNHRFLIGSYSENSDSRRGAQILEYGRGGARPGNHRSLIGS